MTNISITIDEGALLRLGAYAQNNSLETFSEAIASLLDVHNNVTQPKSQLSSSEVATRLHANFSRRYGKRLEVIYLPSGEENFKRQFLECKKAYIRIFYTDGKIINKTWNAQRFTKASSVRGNLASGYLRGWQQEGICRAKVSIEPFKDSQGGE